jgi:hypothetical protein
VNVGDQQQPAIGMIKSDQVIGKQEDRFRQPASGARLCFTLGKRDVRLKPGDYRSQ